jgi:AraC-like DNA-binding protein
MIHVQSYERTNSMDLLADLLQQSGLRRRLLDLRHLDDAVATRFPCGRSIGLHVVTHGHAFVHASTLEEPLALAAGDIALMARGCDHVVATRASLRGVRIEPAHAAASDGAAVTTPAPSPGASAVVSGAYQFWNDPVHPFFAEIPDWFVLRAEQLPRLGDLSLTVALLAQEAARRELGSEIVVHGLLDVAFTYLLRAVVEQQGAAGAGWSHAVRDPEVRRLVALMHDDCAYPWTLETLAQRAGMSRTRLAERFREAMGDTPLNYLRTVRIQQAMRLLSETDRTLDAIARSVGYEDAFGFSKMFKRTVGVPPREFRRRDAEDRMVPWRFGAAA